MTERHPAVRGDALGWYLSGRGLLEVLRVGGVAGFMSVDFVFLGVTVVFMRRVNVCVGRERPHRRGCGLL